VHKPAVRLNTYVYCRNLLDNHILPALGHIQLQKLAPEHIEAFYTHKRDEGISAGTVHLMHSVLHKALEQAVQRGRIPRNVCDFVSPPRIPKHEVQALTPEQAHKLLEAANGHRIEALLTLALVTGMRRGELLGLRWQDIDFENKSVHIRRTLSYITGYGFKESEPKTASSRRKIMLPQFVLDVLKQHRAQQLQERLRLGDAWQDRGLVFCNTRGGFLRPMGLHDMFEKLLVHAGLPHMRFHDLRHSAATILLSMGVPAKVVQELLGHSTIRMTMDTYSHVLPAMQQDAMEKWDDWFEEQF
jgi:integrase